MTKVNAHGSFNNSERNVKNGTISKKKHQEFKKTHKGKIALTNGSQTLSNGNLKNQKNGVNFQLQTKLPKSSNKQSTSPSASTSGVKFPKVKIEPEEEKDNTVSSDEDINERITIKQEYEEFDVDSDAEDAVENKGIKMLESLKQEIKQEPSGDNAENVMENKGMKMFESLKQEIKQEPPSSDAEDAVENERIKMLESLKQDIKEEPSSDEAEDAVENRGINMFVSLKQEVKEEPSSSDDDDDDEEESEEDEEDEKAGPGLAALLGPSIADESDDDDFEAVENDSDDDDDEDDEDEDDDEDDEDEEYDEDDEGLSPDITVTKGENDYEKDAVNDNDGESIKLTKKKRKERNKRTLLIDNVPKESDMLTLEKEFRQFGIIESMRPAGIVPLNKYRPDKVAAILDRNRQEAKTVAYFVTFKNKESAKNARGMNRMKWDGNILKVNFSRQREIFDEKKTVYLTNLPSIIEGNEVRKIFEQCGSINALKIFRNHRTGLGRGDGYINFQSVDGAVRALDLNGTLIKNHEIRVMADLAASKKERLTQKNKENGKNRTTTVYLKNLPFTIEDHQLRNIFERCGPINSLQIYKNRQKQRCGLMHFESVDGAVRALDLNGTSIKNREIRVTANLAVSKKERLTQKNKENGKIANRTTTVYLKNLPFTIEDHQLRNIFKRCGPINSLQIFKNHKKQRCGRIHFESVDGAKLAMNLNGTSINKHKILITPDYGATRRKDRRIEKKNEKTRKRSLSGTVDSASRKKRQTANSEADGIAIDNSVNAERHKVNRGKKKRSQGEEQRLNKHSSPQGNGEGKYLEQKFDAKKKPKQNKSAKKNNQTTAKVLAKSKKPAAT